MRNSLIATLAAGLCALTLAVPAGAEDQRKLDNAGRLDWLELRTLFAGSDGPIARGKADQRNSVRLDLAQQNRPATSALDLLAPHVKSAWDLIQQQAEVAAKIASKTSQQASAGAVRTTPELATGWQHAS